MPNLSVVIPARNEEATIGVLVGRLRDIFHDTVEIIVVNDHSTDKTVDVAMKHGAWVINNYGKPGYGNTARTGLLTARGTYVTVMVADLSDDPMDLYEMYAHRGYDHAVFGDRFSGGGETVGYPVLKRIANRVGNSLAAWLTGTRYRDLTNPFKLYHRRSIVSLVEASDADDFSLGFELALRFVLEGGKFEVVPQHWVERSVGTSKFKVKHVIGYSRTLARVLLQRTASRGSVFGH